MKFSIVPEIINSKGMKFLDERDMEVILCEQSISSFVEKFNKPFLIIDSYAKKTTKIAEIVPIGDTVELKKLGFVITVSSVKTKERNYVHQKRIYTLERVSERTPEGRRLGYIPTGYRIQKDVANRKVRIVGPSAGYPYYTSEYGNCGPWKEIE